MTTSAEQSNMASEPGAGPSPRKFKASELPLPSATRAAIESLAHSFKKEGAYDSIRKQVWDKFGASVCRTATSCCYCFSLAITNKPFFNYRTTKPKLQKPSSRLQNKKLSAIRINSSHWTGERPQHSLTAHWKDQACTTKPKKSLGS